jgi:hypothetical protein
LNFLSAVAEVSVSKRGEVRVERVVCAVDCGHVVNPLTVAEQMEGGVVYGLTYTLYGQITIEKGRAVEGNFDTYQMLRMHQMPEVETHLALTGGDKWGGIGEPSVPPIGPAVCLNDQLIEVTARLTQEQGLHAERLARHEEIMASLAQTLAAIKDMLNRPNGH